MLSSFTTRRLAALGLAAALAAGGLQAGNPLRAEHFLRKGMDAMEAGELGKAENLFLRARRADPVLPQPEVLLGHLAMTRDRFDEAEVAFERAIELHRALKTNLQRRAAQDMQASRDNLEILENELARSENQRDSFSDSRRVQLEAEKMREERKLERADDPEVDARIPGDLFLFLGNARMRAGRPAAAVAAYREAARRLPDHPEPHHNLAVALFQTDRVDEALRECRLAERMGYEPSIALRRHIASLRTEAAAEPKVD